MILASSKELLSARVYLEFSSCAASPLPSDSIFDKKVCIVSILIKNYETSSGPFQILITQTEFTFDKAAEPLRVAPAKGYKCFRKISKGYINVHFTRMDLALKNQISHEFQEPHC